MAIKLDGKQRVKENRDQLGSYDEMCILLEKQINKASPNLRVRWEEMLRVVHIAATFANSDFDPDVDDEQVRRTLYSILS